MFIDTSVIVAILAQEDDGPAWSKRMESAERLLTSPLVILEATMVLSTRRIADPLVTQMVVSDFLRSSGVEIVPIEEADGELAIRAFRDYGKGRGHPAQLNLADCLSYACAKNRGLSLLYKGDDFARTDLA
ncbi:type II toxin-antitoxin system VapC family toxin [Neorhizobium galegae]|uniref:type II toxin-antitoxin system VapC family toxin n=1 Tax=Neorhizobium galegae TaxID=399 RepID=UPI000621AFFA|nr:type II toxin-antitoxin system VapC family toxin [Neorhizobium galegae]CDZ56721.1 PilT protein domain protein [Neorhizobium galegae bv. orientalis]MCQ1570234.1 type II toxin-antitoxin system VapC family toxin [Neorhizobium galegae]MCQ1807769.1 type II toxin-antitoxin system VapC family toxin [Neorhizobium galegae]MCQ1838338.1 type II toxin-antitoxin system VapC family toxin [Neorhizobium galegae]